MLERMAGLLMIRLHASQPFHELDVVVGQAVAAFEEIQCHGTCLPNVLTRWGHPNFSNPCPDQLKTATKSNSGPGQPLASTRR